MYKWRKPKRAMMLGVDMTPAAVNMLEMSVTNSAYCVLRYCSMALPSNMPSSGAVINVDEIASIIKTAYTTHSFSCRHVALAIPDAASISKIIQVNAHFTRKEIAMFVSINAAQTIPYPADEMYLDFAVLGPSMHGDNLLDVLLVAARLEIIATRVQAIVQAGLEVRIIDLESFAIARAVQKCIMPHLVRDINDVVILLVFNEYTTQLLAIEKHSIIFAHEDAHGWKSNVNVVTSEEQKIAQVTLQIKHLLQQFAVSDKACAVHSLLLSGTMHKLANFVRPLMDSLHLPVALANPLQYINCAAMVAREVVVKDASLFMVSSGLALRA